MPTIVVGTEENFAALRPLLFRGRVSSAVAKEAAQAIREANQHADLDKLEPGTVLTVPEGVPGVSAGPGPSLVFDSTNAVAGLSARGKQQLDALAEAAKTRNTATRADRQRVAKALDSPPVAAAAKRDKRLAADLNAARAALEEEEAKAKERAAELEKARAEWSAGLDSLTAMLPDLPGVTPAPSSTRATRHSRA